MKTVKELIEDHENKIMEGKINFDFVFYTESDNLKIQMDVKASGLMIEKAI